MDSSKETVAGQKNKKKSNKQEKIFMCVCILIIVCVVGGFVLDNFGIFRFLPREISDCVGADMEVFRSKYHMNKHSDDSIGDDNVLINSDDDGKIVSVYSDCKGVFQIHGITCGMGEEEVIQKKPQSYRYYFSKDGSDFYLSYDTNRILSFNFENNYLKKLSYYYYDLSSSRTTEETQKQDSADRETLLELPREVSGFLEKEITEVKRQYQLETSKVVVTALEKDNVSMLDNEEDGKIDTIIIGDNSGQYTLLGMNCDITFNEKYVPSTYTFCDSSNIYASGIVASYTTNDYVSDDRHKKLEIQYWKNKRIKQISLIYSKEEIVLEDDNFASENQDDDLIYDSEYYEDYDYDYEEDDSEYYEDYNYYDYDYEEDDSYEETYNLEYSQAITQKAINARWDNPDSYILPNSDKKKLSEKKLNKLNLRTIQFAIDELCARHGRKFDDKLNSADYGDMKDYFESKNWYQAVPKRYKPQKFDTKIRNQVFNEVETYNFFLLAKVRDKKKNK